MSTPPVENALRFAASCGLLLVTIAALALLAGCGADSSTRLGAEGEIYTDDLDCRAPLVCRSAVCSPLSAASNATSSNSATSSSNATSGRQVSCDTICEELLSCLDVDEDIDECAEECRRSIAQWSDAEYDVFVECLFDASCSEIANGALDDCVPFDE